MPRDGMEMTLRELHFYTVGRAKQIKEEWKQKITIAHTTASLMRVKKMPRLASILPREIRNISAEQRAHETRALIQRMARPGEVQYGRKKK